MTRHCPAPIDVATVDLDLVADRDVRAAQRPRARRDDPVAVGSEVHDVQVTPRDAVLGDHQVVQVRCGARVPGVRARGIPGGRPEDAADGGAVRVVGDRALAGAMTGGREHDPVAVARVEPAGTHAPQLLAGEHGRVVHRGGPVRLHRPPDRQGADREQEADQDGKEQMDGADPPVGTPPGHSCHCRPSSRRVAHATRARIIRAGGRWRNPDLQARAHIEVRRTDDFASDPTSQDARRPRQNC